MGNQHTLISATAYVATFSAKLTKDIGRSWKKYLSTEDGKD